MSTENGVDKASSRLYYKHRLSCSFHLLLLGEATPMAVGELGQTLAITSHVEHFVGIEYFKTAYWLEHNGQKIGWVLYGPWQNTTTAWSFRVHPSCWDEGVAERLYDFLLNNVTLSRPSMVVMAREYDLELHDFLKQKGFWHFATVAKYPWFEQNDGQLTPALEFGRYFSADEVFRISRGRFF